MTRDEFVSNGVAWHGTPLGWQKALSRTLGVDSRTIRRAVADGPSDRLARELLALLGDAAPARVPAEWICGDGDDGHEYIVHLRQPRFACLVLTEDEYARFEAQSPGDYQVDGQWLCGFHWIDRRPDALASLMERAANALEAAT